MNNKFSKFNLSINFENTMYTISGISILIALILNVISILELCSQQCSEVHKFLIYGMSFEIFGLVFLTSIGIIHLLQLKFKFLQFTETILFGTALGAELNFLMLQKYAIGSWCPICLGIAACVAVGFLALASTLVKNTKTSIMNEQKEENMRFLLKNIFVSTSIFVGFFAAFLGVASHNTAHANEELIREQIVFKSKNKNTKIDVYIFSDWTCPACRKLDPQLKQISNAIIEEANLYFVDLPIHKETTNFTPYHLSYMVHNKEKYFECRETISNISKKDTNPSEEIFLAASQKMGIKFTKLPQPLIDNTTKYFAKLTERFKVESTPTIVITNSESKLKKRLTKTNEQTSENIMKVIKALKDL